MNLKLQYLEEDRALSALYFAEEGGKEYKLSLKDRLTFLWHCMFDQNVVGLVVDKTRENQESWEMWKCLDN